MVNNISVNSVMKISLAIIGLFFTLNSAAQLVVSGSETLVNSTTAKNQVRPSVAIDTGGNYVIVWSSFEEDGDDYGIYGQGYTNGGATNGAQFNLSPTSTDGQTYPDIAMDASGDFVVVWQSYEEDGDGQGIYARRYTAPGSPAATDFRVNSSSSNDQMHPAVAVDETNNMTFVWMDINADGDAFGIFRRRYLSSGAAIESPVLVNTTTAGYQGLPDVAMDPSGNSVVVWQGVDADGMGIFAQMYDNTGSAVGSEMAINTTTAENQINAAVAMDDNGNFYITWSSMDQDGDHLGIYGRLYNSSGAAQTGEVIVNTTTASTQDNSAISATKDGNYLVSWTSFDQDGNKAGVYAQTMSSLGAVSGTEILVNTRTADYQQLPAVAAYDENDAAVVAWQDGLRNSTSTHDGDGYGIYTQSFMVSDITDPVAVCQNITTYLDGSGNVTITGSDIDGGSTDNVGVTTLTLSTSAFTCADIGSNSTTLTVGDAAGNTDACVATVTVADTTSPTAVCQNVTLYLDGTGNASMLASDIDGGSSDNCSTVSLAASQTAFTCAEVGANSVTLTVTDGSGNTSTCISTVTIADTTSPAAVCQNLTVYLDGSGNASITGGDVDGGSSDGCSSVTTSLDVSSFTCADIGANTVTFTATDASANSSSCTATITVADSTSPTAVCQNITVFLDGTGNATITTGDVDGGSSDNCSTVSLGLDVTSFTCADVGANTVTLTATDGSSNSSTCTATVTVTDTVSPVASCQNITVYLDGAGNASITSGDIDNGSTDNCSAVTLGLDVTSFTCADVGANTVTLTATDASANASTCTATVTVADSTSPTAVCQNINAYLDGTGIVTIVAADIDGGSSDNCGSVTLVASQTAFTCADLGANNVTLTVTDGGANTDVCVGIVTIADTTSPSITCPGNQTENPDASCNFTLPDYTSLATSSDNCGSVTITQSPIATTVITGTTTITLTADDGNGNTSTCTFDVVLNDATPPTVVCQNINAYLDGAGNVSINASDLDGGSTDNCGGVTFSATQTAFTCSDIGANNVTLTVTDANSNSATCVALVTVIDTISPSAVCQNISAYLDGAGNVSITASDIDGGSADNCSTVSLSASTTSFTCADVGANNVTLTVTDGSSNTSTCVAVVTVMDTVSPTAVCQNISVFIDGAGNASIVAADIDGGSTDNCSSVTLSASTTSFTCADAGANNVTLTVTDGNANIATCVAVVTVLDTVSPTAVCQNINAYLDGSGNVTIVAADLDGGSTDNCGGVTLSASQTAFNCANLGANNVTLTATDGSSNTNACVGVVTIMDTISPTITCPGNQTENPDALCNFTLPDYTSLGSASDNCGSTTITQSPVSSTIITGTTTITLTADDGNGNTSTCTFDVILNDGTAPTAVCQNISVYLDATGNVTIADADLDGGSTDNCSGLTFAASQTAFTCADLGTNNITLTVTDGNSNSSNCIAVVTVIDTISPVANVTPLADVTGECNVVLTAPTATDNCAGTVTATTVDPTTYNLEGTYVVTWTYDDGNGNTAIQTQNVIVDDTTAAVVTCPGDQTETPGASCDFTLVDYTGLVTAADNCSSSITITQSPAAGNVIIGNTTIWMYADDGNGNVDSCSFDVLLLDAVAPTAVCQNITIYLDSTGNTFIAAADLDGGSTDNCSGISFSAQTAYSCADLGVNTITLYVTDGSGNIDSCSADVTVLDSIGPIPDVTPLADITGECNVVVTAPTATDACAGSITGTTTDPTTYSTEGTYVVTWTYDDGNGNTTIQTQNVIVDDTTAAVVTCPGDQNETPIVNCEFTLPDYTGLVTAVDNCSSSVVVTQSPVAGTVINGNTTISMYADDGNGNVDSCTFDVILLDVTAPTAICQDITVYLDTNGLVTISGVDIDGGSTDNCTGFTLNASPSNLTCADLGVTAVSLIVIDGSGNSDTCLANVTVMDTIAPIADISPLTAYGECSVTATAPTATDNCAGTVTGTTSDPITYNAQGSYTITWTYDDGNGNSSSQTQTVTVADTTGPVVTCPGDQNETPIANCEFVLPDYTGLASATDACGGPSTITQSPASGTSIFGNTVIYMIGSDTLGNVDTCTFNVILLDVTPPVAVCQNATVYLDSTGSIVLSGSEIDGGSTDNCTGFTLSASPSTFDCADTGIVSVTLIVTDGGGNVDSCAATITIIDSLAPVADSALLADVNGECSASVTAPTATDNCSGAIVATTTDPLSYTVQGTYTVTWTYDDGNGNVSTQLQTVNVNDTTAPMIVCNGDTTLNATSGQCDVIVNGIAPLSTADNCDTLLDLTYTLSGATAGSGSGDVSGTSFTAGVTNVTYIVTDDNGNADSCSFNITVIDTEPPVITCGGDIDVALDSNCAFTLLDYTTMATVVDNCSVTYIQSPSAGTLILDTTVVTIIATDPSGNADSCSFVVNPSDVTAPIFTCVGDQVLVLDDNCEAIIPDYSLGMNISDYCDTLPTVTQSPAVGTVYSSVSTVATYVMVQDASGNTDTCFFNVSVETDANSGCQDTLIIADLLTPNGDGVNDTWLIEGLSLIDGCTVSIFNRWGNKLYETTSYQNEWDGTKNGKLLPDGAYFYVIECDGEVSYKGPVTLMRLSK